MQLVGSPLRGSSRCVAFVVVFVAIAACGNSHGIEPDAEGVDASIPRPPLPLSTREADLTEEEYAAFCEWWEGLWGTPDDRRLYCLDGGAFASLLTVEQCRELRIDPAELEDCDVRIQDWYDCALAADWCTEVPPECRRPPGCGPPQAWL